MANRYKLSYLLIALAALVMCSLATACKRPTVPSDVDLMKVFRDNHKEYEDTVKAVMAEGNQKFIVTRGKSVTYQGGDKPPVSDKTRFACQQVMNRTFCLATRKDGGMIQFIFFEDNTIDHFRSKSIIYDSNDFKDPIWVPKSNNDTNLRYVPIETNWTLEYRYDKRKP
jgi:hypothetical protein